MTLPDRFSPGKREQLFQATSEYKENLNYFEADAL
jgi:hypothetical protein